MYLTSQKFTEMTGLDLKLELSSRVDSMYDNADVIFIQQVEDFVQIKYKLEYGFTEPQNAYQEECFSKAIMYQILYELQNGSIWNDSGYNLGTGQVISQEQLQKTMISPQTHNFMRIGGMANVRSVF